MTETVKIDTIDTIGVVDWNDWSHPKAFTYTPMPLRDDWVDVQVIACGICGSDMHQVKGDWGKPYCPIAVGHEVVGYVVNKGKAVTELEIGDRVGIGAQIGACHECIACGMGRENICDKQMGTYGTPLPNGSGTQGGYGKFVRCEAGFAFKIPEKIKTEHAAPLMCGGMTGFRPLMTAGVKKGTKVGIVGLGGIGHMTLMFAKALGAEVTVISRSSLKEDLAKKLGADHYVATDDPNFPASYSQIVDVIVNTSNSFSEEKTGGVLSLLRPEGRLIFITAPEVSERFDAPPFAMITKNLSISASCIGSREDIKYMLNFAAEHDIKPWVETVDINVDSVTTCWDRMEKGDVRFRFVLTGYDKYYGN